MHLTTEQGKEEKLMPYKMYHWFEILLVLTVVMHVCKDRHTWLFTGLVILYTGYKSSFNLFFLKHQVKKKPRYGKAIVTILSSNTRLISSKSLFYKVEKNEKKGKKKDWQNVSYVSKRHGMSNISPPILEAIVLSKKHHQLFHVLGLPGFEE